MERPSYLLLCVTQNPNSNARAGSVSGGKVTDTLYSSIEIDRSDVATEKLDLLILGTLALGPRHGYGISQRIKQVSRGVFQVTLGALYPALQRLERVGAVTAKWSVSENNRRARYYSLTSTGRRRLAEEQREWERAADAMTRMLRVDAE